MIIGGLKVYYCFSVPYYLAFGWNKDRGVIPWDMFFDSLLFVDIILKLSTAYIKDSRLIDDRLSIFKKVLFNGLPIDVLCVIPLYAAYHHLMWFRILRLFQLNELRNALENLVRPN